MKLSYPFLFFVWPALPTAVQASHFFMQPRRSTMQTDRGAVPHQTTSSMNPIHPIYAKSLVSTRGGACQDTDMTLFIKVGVAAVVEAATMLGALKLGKLLTGKFPSLPKLPGNQSIPELVSALAVTLGSSLFGSLAEGGLSVATRQLLEPNMTPGDPIWYSNLKKPWWNPPGWLFPIMWLLIVKPTQAWGIARVLKVSDEKFPWLPLGAFTGHLALGDAWNKVFFGMQCTGRGAALISVFYGALLASMRLFFKVDSLAGKLLLPSFGWISVATSLNWSIFFLNKKK
uniref:Uncharacterized protein n=1 Tax=Amphora coffeiformis TaxID=265554 RepID=A0A7S3PBU0_9STRA